MQRLEVLNPVAALSSSENRAETAARPTSLDGKKIGLVWNRKRGGDAVLERVGELLRKRYRNVETVLYRGGIPCPQTVLDRAVEECDAFVGSSSD